MSKKQSFEEVLESFKQQQPNELQLRRWQASLLKRASSRPWAYAAAGLIAGFMVGAILMREFIRPAEEVNFSATYVQYNVKNL